MKFLKAKIKEWYKDEMEGLIEEKDHMPDLLGDWESMEEQRDLIEDETKEKHRRMSKLWELLRREEVKWRQKSRATWLK